MHSILLLEQVDGDGQRGRGGGRAERRRDGVHHVPDERERKLPRAQSERTTLKIMCCAYFDKRFKYCSFADTLNKVEVRCYFAFN